MGASAKKMNDDTRHERQPRAKVLEGIQECANVERVEQRDTFDASPEKLVERGMSTSKRDVARELAFMLVAVK